MIIRTSFTLAVCDILLEIDQLHEKYEVHFLLRHSSNLDFPGYYLLDSRLPNDNIDEVYAKQLSDFSFCLVIV
jgi:hypothetical protein